MVFFLKKSVVFFVAVDYNGIIYTLATCGVDHIIKIWRIFSLAEPVCGRRKSRLIPKEGEHRSGTSIVYNKATINAECILDILAHGSSLTCVRYTIENIYRILI